MAWVEDVLGPGHRVVGVAPLAGATLVGGARSSPPPIGGAAPTSSCCAATSGPTGWPASPTWPSGRPRRWSSSNRRRLPTPEAGRRRRDRGAHRRARRADDPRWRAPRSPAADLSAEADRRRLAEVLPVIHATTVPGRGRGPALPALRPRPDARARRRGRATTACGRGPSRCTGPIGSAPAGRGARPSGLPPGQRAVRRPPGADQRAWWTGPTPAAAPRRRRRPLPVQPGRPAGSRRRRTAFRDALAGARPGARSPTTRPSTCWPSWAALAEVAVGARPAPKRAVEQLVAPGPGRARRPDPRSPVPDGPSGRGDVRAWGHDLLGARRRAAAARHRRSAGLHHRAIAAPRSASTGSTGVRVGKSIRFQHRGAPTRPTAQAAGRGPVPSGSSPTRSSRTPPSSCTAEAGVGA